MAAVTISATGGWAGATLGFLGAAFLAGAAAGVGHDDLRCAERSKKFPTG